MRIRVCALLLALPSLAQTPQRPWQQITVPSASEAAAYFGTPPREYGAIRDYAKVRLNGVDLPARAWQPYRWDVSAAKVGKNVLEIEVRGSPPPRGPAPVPANPGAAARPPAPPVPAAVTGILAPLHLVWRGDL